MTTCENCEGKKEIRIELKKLEEVISKYAYEHGYINLADLMKLVEPLIEKTVKHYK